MSSFAFKDEPQQRFLKGSGMSPTGWNMDCHKKAYVCTHVFHRERPVLLVTRPDGDWCLLCGDEHEDSPSAYRVVGIGHVVEHDPSLEAVLDVQPGWEAERSARGEPWERRPLPDE